MGNSNALLLQGLAKNNNGNTALVQAAELGNYDAVKILNKTSNMFIPKQKK